MKDNQDSLDCKTHILDNLHNISFKDEIASSYKTDFYEFASKKIFKHNTMIDISKIKGTNHPDYTNKKWIDVFKSLKRDSNLKHLYCDGNKRLNKQYYYDLEYREKCSSDNAWGINILNDEKYYISEGNHRSTIAKFLSELKMIPKMIPIPRVNYYYFDENDIELFNRLKKAAERLNKNSLENYFYIKIEKEQKVLNIDKKEDNTIESFKIIYQLTIFFHHHDYRGQHYKEYDNLKTLQSNMFTELKKYRIKTRKNIIEKTIINLIKKYFIN